MLNLFGRTHERKERCRTERHKNQTPNRETHYQPIRRSSIIYSIALISLLGGCKSSSQTSFTPTNADGILSIGIGAHTPGNFIIAGERYGYLYELSRSFAATEGMELTLAEGLSTQQLHEGFIDGSIEVGAVTTAAAESQFGHLPAHHYLTTHYVILGKNSRAPLTSEEEAGELLADCDVLVDAAFAETYTYDQLLGATPEARFYLSSASGFQMASELANGDWDLLICEQTDASLATAFFPTLRELHIFDEKVDMSLVFANQAIAESYRHWYREFDKSPDHTALTYLYIERGVAGELAALRHAPTRVVNGISVWDELLKRVSESEGVDWRLLSAIAYAESRFRADVVSHQGAVGLMQVMPSVAAQFDVAREELANPETNIKVSAKLLNKIDRTIGFAPSVSSYDRMAIVLAAYNCGVGRISQARSVVAERGGNPDSWEAVSEVLRLMSDAEFVAQCGGKVRRFSGSRHTLAYVDQVMGRYNTYCDTIPQ